MLLQNTPIRKKLITVILITCSAALLLMATAFITYEIIAVRKIMVNNLTTRAKIIASNSTASLAFRNSADATDVLSALSSDQHIISGCIYDQDKNIFAVYPAETPLENFPVAPNQTGYKFAASTLTISIPITQKTRVLGTVYIESDLEVLTSRYQAYIYLTIIFVSISILVAFLISRILQKQISQPIIDLADTAQAISEQRDFSVRAIKQGDDELGLLTSAFNQMLNEIEEQNEALRTSEERLRLVLQNMPVMMNAFDAAGNIVVWNRECEQITGYKAEEIIDNPNAMRLLYPDQKYRAKMQEEWDKRGNDYYDWEWQLVDKNGETKTVSWSSISSRFPIAGWASWGIGVDVSERKQQEQALKLKTEELMRSNKELEQYAYVASHDLQEPLRTIASCVEIFQYRYQGKIDKQGDELISHTINGAVRMQNLIKDLLQLSRIGKRSGNYQMIDSGLALEAAINNLSNTIKETEATINKPKLPAVVADITQLTQLFQNLISNALKFRAENPPIIDIDVQRNGKNHVFSIQDNGIGIDKDYHDRIFRMFQRLHPKNQFPGTGIGLALCKKIVESHGGQIWVESKNGDGTKFLFTLP